MKHVVVFFVFFILSPIFGQIENPILIELSNQEKESLKVFIRTFMEDSEGGYVFFGKKPVCIHGYPAKDSFMVNSDWHKEVVAMKEGASVWKKLKKASSDVLIHINEKLDPKINSFHILMINVPLFHRVVNENLSLFQYILGPSITSKKLLDSLVYEDQPFHWLLKYDKVLIGILLGFGVENSLYISRIEDVDEVGEKEFPPFRPLNVVQKEFQEEYLPFPPSFKFNTIKEERERYLKKISISSEKLIKKKPNFIFGWLKGDIYTIKFIAELEEVQKKIQNLLRSHDFEIPLIEKMTGNPRLQKLREISSVDLKKNDANKIIAKAVWNSFKWDDFDYLSYLIEGMDNPDFRNLEVKRSAYFSNYFSDFITAKKKLTQANLYFKTLNENKGYQCLKPLKLYYKTLEASNNNKNPSKASLATLTYSLYSPLNHCLGHETEKIINLKNVIPGFAQGVYGMCIGETREIYIHPALAYGFETNTLEKCIYLKAIVTLHATHNEAVLDQAEGINLDFLLDLERLKKRQENFKNSLRIRGALIAQHLKKSNHIDLPSIKNYLIQFNKNRNEDTSINKEEQDFVNHIHWMIYYIHK